jgi:hypothetical protein
MTKTSRAALLRRLKQSEKSFQRQVIDLAHLHGWTVAHFRPAMDRDGRWKTPVQADGAGFPDLVLVRPPRIIFVELKRDGAKLTDLQNKWADMLLACCERGNVDYFLWRPNIWDNIVATLSKATLSL